ncbi:hypothetical protein HH214_10465 [Mucilaginibacter robiniae]|uniref:Uncharacterized protein n=1 Tax=Mucilaginibacter robiniae TaxID=2728022 RepID=A0A7L5E7B1_9SPHI|nr:hypothetical protein [Mucilaginibacter robiniae]QJD96256.1 hypothetical protein HH214_10465 [Mucilaginibacter robiniae]
MLKNKIQTLVTRENLGDRGNFEIIYDSNAADILGGLEACPYLGKCGTYTGDCQNLTNCGTYTDAA